MKSYAVNEIFYSIQGEGVRVGTPNLFIRFQGCNLRCAKSTHGFDCDTEFVSGRKWTMTDILAEMRFIAPSCKSVILTGGEPGLQADPEFCGTLKSDGYYLAIETNGTVEIPDAIDWITVSPKVAEHAIAQKNASEVKYVRSYGQGIPRTVVAADYYLISPAFNGDSVEKRTLEWCVNLVKQNPSWRLSPQMHKWWGVR